MALTLALCFGSGISLGLLGAGGSILLMPVFVYTAGRSAEEAISISLGVACVTSLAGAAGYLIRGFVNARLAAIFTGSGALGAFFGARLTPYVSDQMLLFFFGILMAGTGLLLVLKKEGREDDSAALKCHPLFFSSLLTGAGIGVLTGFLGVGGGFLIVPALLIIMKCSMKSAAGTSLLIISANSLAGFLGHASTGGVDWRLTAISSAAAICGALSGNLLSGKISGGFLKKVFALLIIGIGIFLISQNIPV